MNCGHEFIFNYWYIFEYDGSCDGCGAVQNIGKVFGSYQGDSIGHRFLLGNPFSCIGCHRMVESVTIICGGISVTEELKAKRQI